MIISYLEYDISFISRWVLLFWFRNFRHPFAVPVVIVTVVKFNINSMLYIPVLLFQR